MHLYKRNRHGQLCHPSWLHATALINSSLDLVTAQSLMRRAACRINIINMVVWSTDRLHSSIRQLLAWKLFAATIAFSPRHCWHSITLASTTTAPGLPYLLTF